MPEEIKAMCSIFADDTKIAGKVKDLEHSLELQEDLEKLQKWTDIWKLKFNATKCKVMHFGPKNQLFDYTMKVNLMNY